MLKYLLIKLMLLFVVWFLISVNTEVLLSLLFSNAFEPVAAIMRSIFSSLFFSMSIVAFHLIRLKKLKVTSNSKHFFAIVQKKIIDTNLKMEDIAEIVESLFGRRMKPVNKASLMVGVFSWFSWSRLTITQIEDFGSFNRFELVCEPSLPFSFVDFGENYLTMRKVCESLGVAI